MTYPELIKNRNDVEVLIERALDRKRKCDQILLELNECLQRISALLGEF